MNLVTDELVEQAWQEVAALGDDTNARRLMDEFSANQPAVAEFLGEVNKALSPDAADLGYFAALVVWRAFHHFAGARILKAVPTTVLVEEFKNAEAWMDSLEGLDDLIVDKKIRDPKEYRQPHLMHYVTEAIFDAHEDGLELTNEEIERLFVCLKVVTDSLNRAETEALPGFIH